MRPALQETVMEWTQEWKRIGFEEGLRQGMTTFLTHQLEFNFGPLSPEDRQRLETADPERLLEWCDRLLGAKSVAEVFAG